MKKELIVEKCGMNIDAQDIKDMKRLYEDIDILVAGEKTHCVLNVLLNLPITQMLRMGYSDERILTSIKKILKQMRKAIEKDE